MRYTIIPDDNIVSVDGETRAPITLDIDSSIHAVQWYGDFGEIEFKSEFVDGSIVKPSNEVFTDTTRFQAALDAWDNWVEPPLLPGRPLE